MTRVCEPTETCSSWYNGEPMSQEQLNSAKQVLAGFISSRKNFALYPANHPVCQQNLVLFNSRLTKYLDSFGDLHLEVRDNELLVDDEAVYRESEEAEGLATLFYRDGVKWFELQQGIGIDEITRFFKIINKYWELNEEADGDLVTALWEADLPCFSYQAVDLGMQGGEMVDPAQLKSLPDDMPPGDGNPAASIPHYDQVCASNHNRAQLELTPDEAASLQRMILEEESKDAAEEALEVLIIILLEQQEPDEVAAILAFMLEEFVYDLGSGNFRGIRNLLLNLKVLGKHFRQEKPWALPLIGNFFKEVSGTDVLKALEKVLPTLDVPEVADQLQEMEALLIVLEPEAVEGLAALLHNDYPEPVAERLISAIGKLADRDLKPFARLLEKADDELTRKLIMVLQYLPEAKTASMLNSFIEHPAEKVRLAALEILLQQGRIVPAKLAKLIEDPNIAVRRLVYGFISRSRSTSMENFLLQYLGSPDTRQMDDDQLLACYTALGKCGSSRSIPFLKRVLLADAWKGVIGIGRVEQRYGAAKALRLLSIDEAAAILKLAAGSSYPHIRKAALQA